MPELRNRRIDSVAVISLYKFREKRNELQNNNLQIELYNFLGNKVLGRSIDSHDNSIDIGSITKGIYIVKINFNNSLRERSILEKLIIQ